LRACKVFQQRKQEEGSTARDTYLEACCFHVIEFVFWYMWERE